MRGFCLEVTGDYACFTRPEMKVERVSYDVITPSAARAIFYDIFWKPAINWYVTKIEVLNPIRWASVRRNEVKQVASCQRSEIFIEDERTQRAGLILKNVKYRIHAKFEFIPPEKRAKTNNPTPEWLSDADEVELYRQAEVRPDEKEEKYAAMFGRRASKGQCFVQPYLGCREFPCAFRLVKDPNSSAEPRPIDETMDLGFMLFGMNYSDPEDIKPMFYRPKMVNGVIEVPRFDSQEVFK